MFKSKEFIAKLTSEGVMHKGFGIVYKFVMQDTDLSLESKGIYAHVASFAGNKDTAFPGLKKILSDLRISKKGYYPHLRKLIQYGYITVTKSGKAFSHNIYTLNPFPEKFAKYAREHGKDYTHIKDYGYGMIPKAVMLDGRLDIKSKSLYAYYASIGGAEKIAIRSQDAILYHLGVCEKTYYTYYNQLLDLNYITAERQRTKTNRYASNYYYLNPNPDVAKARQPLSTELSTIARKMETAILETANSASGKKVDTNINLRNKNNFNKNNIISSSEAAVEDEMISIKEKLNYNNEILQYADNKDDIDKSIQFCAEILANKRNSFFIGSSFFMKESFKDAVNKLTIPDISDVWARIRNAGSNIVNVKNYVLTSLYNHAQNSSRPDSHASERNDSLRVEYQTFDLDAFFEKAVRAGMKYEPKCGSEPAPA